MINISFGVSQTAFNVNYLAYINYILHTVHHAIPKVGWTVQVYPSCFSLLLYSQNYAPEINDVLHCYMRFESNILISSKIIFGNDQSDGYCEHLLNFAHVWLGL